jgi:hypothetical protein
MDDSQQMSASVNSRRQATRRYFVRFFSAMLVYLVTLFAATYLIRRGLVTGPGTWVLASLPGLAIVGAFYAIAMRMLEQRDEYLRMLMARQLLVATAITLSLTTMWGFLEEFELVPHAELYWVAVLWFASLPLGSIANRVTQGTWGECL